MQNHHAVFFGEIPLFRLGQFLMFWGPHIWFSIQNHPAGGPHKTYAGSSHHFIYVESAPRIYAVAVAMTQIVRGTQWRARWMVTFKKTIVFDNGWQSYVVFYTFLLAFDNGYITIVNVDTQ
jgi:hypothetical protein